MHPVEVLPLIFSKSLDAMRFSMVDIKLATLTELRELTENTPAEIWRLENGKVVLRSYNESGNNFTDIDLMSLLSWLHSDQARNLLRDNGIRTLSSSK